MALKALKQQPEEPHFLTVEEVATLLRVKPRAVYQWVSERKIPFRKAGRYTLFDRAEIVEWTKGEAKKTVTVGAFPR
ncbi:MAG TPA: helix-turn-helix domain-containing protein [Pyrinomonadaceae bacterium]|jgi:excisionase family DNA binding protein